MKLSGTCDPEFVESATRVYREHCEKKATRLCLKHLRQRGLWDAFYALQEQTNTQLEHPTLSKLHQALVNDGDYESTEAILTESCDAGLFHEFIEDCPCRATWERLISTDDAVPGVRGGHQLCIDHATNPDKPWYRDRLVVSTSVFRSLRVPHDVACICLVDGMDHTTWRTFGVIILRKIIGSSYPTTRPSKEGRHRGLVTKCVLTRSIRSCIQWGGM